MQVELPRPDAVVTVFVTKNHDGTFCLRAGNSLEPEHTNKKCLLELPSGYEAAFLIVDPDYDLSSA